MPELSDLLAIQVPDEELARIEARLAASIKRLTMVDGLSTLMYSMNQPWSTPPDLLSATFVDAANEVTGATARVAQELLHDLTEAMARYGEEKRREIRKAARAAGIPFDETEKTRERLVPLVNEAIKSLGGNPEEPQWGEKDIVQLLKDARLLREMQQRYGPKFLARVTPQTEKRKGGQQRNEGYDQAWTWIRLQGLSADQAFERYVREYLSPDDLVRTDATFYEIAKYNFEQGIQRRDSEWKQQIHERKRI